jgi:hypothetical protein
MCSKAVSLHTFVEPRMTSIHQKAFRRDIGSAFGSVPSGSTGGTNVAMIKHVPIERELRSFMQGRGATGSSTSRRNL